MRKSHLVYISVTLADSSSNCPVVQLPTVNVRNVGPSREHKRADVFSFSH